MRHKVGFQIARQMVTHPLRQPIQPQMDGKVLTEAGVGNRIRFTLPPDFQMPYGLVGKLAKSPRRFYKWPKATKFPLKKMLFLSNPP